MRYTLKIATAVMLLLSLLGAYLSLNVYYALALLIFLGGLVAIVFMRKKAIPLLLCTTLISVFCLNMAGNIKVIKRDRSCNERHFLMSFVVTDNSEPGINGWYIAFADTVDSTVLHKGTHTRLYFENDPHLTAGQTVTANVIVYKNADSPATRRASASGPIASAYVKSHSLTGKTENRILSFVYSVRDYVKDVYNDNTKNSAELRAIIAGDTTGLTDSDKEVFRKAGISHLLVVSGFHLSVLYGMIYAVFGLFSLGGIYRDMVACLFSLFVVCLCGFSPSVLRAGLVCAVYYLSHRIGRVTSGFSAWCLGVVVILLINPLAVYNPSFSLSFSSVFGIMVIYPPRQKAIDIKFRSLSVIPVVLKISAVSFSAWLCTLPVIIIYYGKISTVAIIVNLLISLISSLLVMFGAVGLFISFIFKLDFLAVIFYKIADLCCEIIIKICGLFGDLPFAELEFKHRYLAAGAVVLIILVLIEKDTCYMRRNLVKLKRKEGEPYVSAERATN